MRITSAFWLWCGLLCGLSWPGWSQLYPARTYTLRDGLPQMQITSSWLDSRGYLWLGTKDGLAKFDGERFETYSRAELSLSSTYVSDIGEDHRGHLWLATLKGLLRFDGATFHRYLYSPDVTNTLTDMEVDGQGRVWLLNHLWRYSLRCFRRGKLVLAQAEVPALASLTVQAIRWDAAQQRLWLLAKRPGDATIQLFYVANEHLHHIAGYQAPPDWDARFVRASGQVLLFEHDRKGYIRYRTLHARHPADPFVEIRNGQWRLEGRAASDVVLVEPLRGQAMLFYRHNEHRLERIETNDALPAVMKFYNSWQRGQKFYFESEQGLFELTDNGIRSFSPQQAPYVWSVIERPDSSMWLLNYGGTPPQQFRRGRVTSLPMPGLPELLARERPLDRVSWYSYYFRPTYDRDSTLYLPNETGLLSFGRGTWRFLTKRDSSLTLALYTDPNTNRVFGGVKGGFQVYERQQLVRTIMVTDKTRDLNYGLATVTDLTPDIYWLGTSRGLARYNYRTGQQEHFSEEAGTLPLRGVADLCRDGWGTIWMAGRGGIAYYRRGQPRIERLVPSILSGGMAGFVGLLTDSTLAVGGLHGIYLLNLNRFYRTGEVVMQLLNHRTGYMGIEPGQAGFYKDRQGRAWITSGTILSYIDTRRFSARPEPLQPAVRLLNGQRLPFACADSVFTLPGGQTTARVEFEALGDNRPTTTQYAWQLDNGPWSGWQTEPYVVLRDYDGGPHTFQLKARNGGLDESLEKIATLRFEADIPWYKAHSFRERLPLLTFSFFALGIVLLLYVADSRRKARAVAHKLRQREQEALFLNAQALQSQLNTHFMFNAMMPLQHLILQNKPDEAARVLVEFSNLVRRFLNSSAVAGSQQATADREITLADELALLRGYVAFEQRLYGDKITAHFDVDGKLNPEVATLPPLLIQPFVENAIKHGLVHKAGPGNLWVRFVGVGESLICTVEDDGIGRDGMRDIQQKSIKVYKSLGTQIVQQRVDYLNQLGYAIQIQPDDRLGGGTVVTIFIARHADQDHRRY